MSGGRSQGSRGSTADQEKRYGRPRWLYVSIALTGLHMGGGPHSMSSNKWGVEEVNNPRQMRRGRLRLIHAKQRNKAFSALRGRGDWYQSQASGIFLLPRSTPY